MAISEIIATSRLNIVPFEESHLSARYVGWLNNANVVRYSEQRHHVHTLETCRDYWKSFSGTPNYFWAIIARDDAGHIGNINAYVDEANLVAEVGIMIGETTAWRKGYGLEAWRAACEYLLTTAGMRKVTAGTLAENKGMVRIMQESGMTADGRRIRHYIHEGKETDIIHMALFRDEQEACGH